MAKYSTIEDAIASYLKSVSLARSGNTARSYTNALKAFSVVLNNNGLPMDKAKIDEINEDAISWFAVAPPQNEN